MGGENTVDVHQLCESDAVPVASTDCVRSCLSVGFFFLLSALFHDALVSSDSGGLVLVESHGSTFPKYLSPALSISSDAGFRRVAMTRRGGTAVATTNARSASPAGHAARPRPKGGPHVAGRSVADRQGETQGVTGETSDPARALFQHIQNHLKRADLLSFKALLEQI
ncbi:hypothetical protein [Nocardiopsis sp. MG754419]|uniref:hypothetical protein n=1 Tax=Nocardiopsis sp. MG754419 TaxID=2259865 RepID=UPI001BA632BC|nr:hypothetical protein [Nocardiopsis sp. MG754419]